MSCLTWLYLLVSLAVAAPPTGLSVSAPANNDGLNLQLVWTPAADDGERTTGYAVLRAPAEGGPYEVITEQPAGTTRFQDKVTTDAASDPPRDEYYYRVVSLTAASPIFEAPAGEGDDKAEPAVLTQARRDHANRLLAGFDSTAPVRGEPIAALVVWSPGHALLFLLIVTTGGLMIFFARQAQRGKPIFIRRIPGIDAIEEGIGRATEMGKPVLYVPGIDELQDIQTIASMLILGQVSKMVAEYQSDIVVSCCIPIVREVADEVVKAGFYQAGHPDAYSPADIRFISSEQFAFTAGTNGIILREKPATNLYLGRFFAESLILAETGYVNRSIQIAGTAEATQLPFFVAACDYTLIGEELFAVSAYLSQDPRLVSSLKASDYVKVFLVVMILVGTLAATFGFDGIITLFTIAEGA